MYQEQIKKLKKKLKKKLENREADLYYSDSWEQSSQISKDIDQLEQEIQNLEQKNAE